MQILSKQIGRLPFALASILLYISVPLYYAAWEYETVEPYLSEPTGLVMGLFSILGSGIPFCFAHQVGGLASLEFTAPFALLLLLVTLWRCNDCRATARARRPVPTAPQPADARLPDGAAAPGAPCALGSCASVPAAACGGVHRLVPVMAPYRLRDCLADRTGR